MAPSPYGGPPPPPAPGAGGVGIKRRAGRASGSSDPMVMEESSYYGGAPPPPGSGAIAAQILTGILQQSAMAQEAARYAVNEAHLARALQAQSAEAQRMVVPEAIKPVHHNTIKSILEKTRVVQPVTPAAPTAIDQIANVDLSNAEGAARAHARASGDASTMLEKIIDTAAPVRTAASKVLKNFTKGIHGYRRCSSDGPQGLNQEGCGGRRPGASSRTGDSRPRPTQGDTSAPISGAANDRHKATCKSQGRP